MFKLAPLFGNGCVLVRNKEIRIFGGATEGTRVTAELRAADGSLLAKGTAMAQDGSFLLRLPPQKAAVGCTLHVTDGEMLIVSENVAIGEVYFAAGQSNMELELQNADEGKGLIEVHNDPDLRYFNVPKKALWNDDAIQAEGFADVDAAMEALNKTHPLTAWNIGNTN